MYYIQTQKYKNRVHGKCLGIAIPHQSTESVPKCRFGRQLPPGGSDWALPRQCVYQHCAVWLTKADNLDNNLPSACGSDGRNTHSFGKEKGYFSPEQSLGEMPYWDLKAR